MRIKLLVLTILLLFFEVRPTFAVSFTISNPQYNGDDITIDVLLSGLTSSSCLNGSCYLQAAFTSPSPIRYFGFTKNNNGQWYQYISSPTQSYIQSTFFTFQPVSGVWSGQLTLKVNTEDSNYHGPGIYNIKAWRYSGNSNSASGNSDSIPVNIQNSIPTLSSTQTPAPTPSPTPTTSSTSQSTASFTISNIPSQINSDQSFSVSVNLSSPSNPNTNFYLKGAFKKTDSSNYFGLTKVEGEWVKNSSTYTNQYKITTDSSGNWSGNLEIRPDPDDSGFTGTGDYIFRVGKYNATDTSPSVSWSDNESTITITATESGDQDSTSTSTSDTPFSTTNPSTPSIETTINTSIQPKNYDKLIYRIASVAAATTSATPSAIEVKNQRQTNPLLWVGLLFIFAGGGLLGYIYIKYHAKIHFPFGK